MALTLNIDIKTDQGIRFLEFRELKKLGIPHLMTTKDYNTSLKRPGLPEAIEAQYRHILQLLNAPSDRFWLLEQVHSNQVVAVRSSLEAEVFPPGRMIRGVDGMVSNEPGISMATTFADCVPLVLVDPVSGAVANIHSGWKGTLDQIGKTGLQKMIELYGTKTEDVKVFIGPHIQSKDFEVRQDLTEAFENLFGRILPKVEAGNYIQFKDQDHWTIDLSAVIESMFLELGIAAGNIYAARESTYEQSDLFHSWRRDGRAFGIMSLVTLIP